jgi:hypothetical protein
LEKKRVKKEPIDMVRFGAIYDRDGYEDFSVNLGKVLMELSNSKKPLSTETKISVLESRINDLLPEKPRYEMRIEVNISSLKKLYKKIKGYGFNAKKHEQRKGVILIPFNHFKDDGFVWEPMIERVYRQVKNAQLQS